MRIRNIGLATLLAASSTQASPTDWVRQHQSSILSEYVELLALPNVATNLTDIKRNADHILGLMRSRGLAPRLLEGHGPDVPPAIYGEWLVPDATRTVVLYAHYDGQPVTPEDWKSTLPFKPQLYSERLDRGGKAITVPANAGQLNPSWRLYGRSTSDDKLGVMAILAAVDALKAAGKRPAFNLKIFLEGEEEAGSPHLGDLLERHRNTLRSDGWVIFDGPMHPTGRPQISLGVRGVVGVDITVYGPTRPLHSGHYGNWAPNPAMMLAQLLASMKDADGKVRIAGFYDDVEPLSAAEHEAVAAVPPPDDQLKRELGLFRTEGGGAKLAEAIQLPSLNVGGLRSADVGDKARNVVPATAAAYIDMRLVKGNDAKRQVQKLVRHIEAQGFKVLDHDPTAQERLAYSRIVRLNAGQGYNAERTPIDSALATSVITAVKSRGPAVVLPTLGGSLPLYILRDRLGVDSVTVSLANHDNNQHAEDENVQLGSLWQAIDTAAAVLEMR